MDTARVPRQDYGTKEPYSARLPFAFSASYYENKIMLELYIIISFSFSDETVG